MDDGCSMVDDGWWLLDVDNGDDADDVVADGDVDGHVFFCGDDDAGDD